MNKRTKMLWDEFEMILNSNLNWYRFQDKNIIITGATGMLASYLIYFLGYINIRLNLNLKIIPIYRSKEKFKNMFSCINDKTFLLYDINLLRQNEFNKIDRPIHYIIHAASLASSNFYRTNPLQVVLPNIEGTQNLLFYVSNNYHFFEKFLFFSSGEVCGKIDKKIISEDDYGYLNPLDIRSCYGESKRMAETLCKCYDHQYNIHTNIIRPEHTYAPTMDLKTDKRVFAEFVRNIINNEDIIIKSDGKAVRTFTYITDFIDGMFRVLLKGQRGEAYNISNNNCKISIGDLAKKLCKLYPEKKLKVKYEKRDITDCHIENKNKVQPSLSTNKIEQLGYKPKINIEQGFKRVIDFF